MGKDKEVSFEDAHSSASDEDAKAVEVFAYSFLLLRSLWSRNANHRIDFR